MAPSPGRTPSTRAVLAAAAAGLGVALAVWAFSLTPWYSRAEGPTVDARFRARPPIRTPSRVVTIDIDTQALTRQKAWPWPRDRHTRLLGLVRELGVRAIAFDIFFPEASPPASLTRDDFFAHGGHITSDDFPDYDAEFARAIALADNVYLAQLFTFSRESAMLDNLDRLEQAENRLREFVVRGLALPVDEEIARVFPRVEAPDAIPLPRFAGAARGVGAAQVREDSDGVVRHFPIFVRYDLELVPGEGRVPCMFPSLPMLMACDALGVQLSELGLGPGRRVTIPVPDAEAIVIPLNEDGLALVNWAGDWNETFTHVSYEIFVQAIEQQLRFARMKQAVVDAGPEVWEQGFQGLITVLAGFAEDNGELRALFQIFVGAHVYQELLAADATTTAQEAIATVPGLPVENPAVFARQMEIFLNVAAHRAAILREPKPAEVEAAQWERAQTVAAALAEAGGVLPADAPYYFREPIYSDDRLIFAGRYAPALAGATCFYGLTAPGTHDINPMPMNSAYPMLGVHPNLYSSIVTDQLLWEMPRAWRIPVFVIFGLIVALYAVDKGAAHVVLTTGGVLAAYVGGVYGVFVYAGWVIEVVGPVAVVLGTASIVAYQNYRREERQRKFIRGAFEQYMNVNIVERIAKDPDSLKLGGQELDATAFFSDVAGFTTISEELSSQDLVALLNEYLTAMTELVFKYDGLLDKYEGDAIIAIFGAPLQTEDHATKACHASIDMQRKLTEMRAVWKAQGRHEMTVRIGLCSGLMTVGNMGSTMRFDYTMMGDTVNLAARLEGANKQYATHLMCSESTIERCGGSVQARELDLLRVKGKRQPVRVFEVYAKEGDTIEADMARAFEHYLEGIRLYRDWQFAEAVAEFERALAIMPDDGPSKTYLQRCQMCIANPPPPEWDGVFTMTTK